LSGSLYRSHLIFLSRWRRSFRLRG
jgi:hypothetical protein